MQKLTWFAVLLFMAIPAYAQHDVPNGVQMSFGDSPVQSVGYWQYGDDEPRSDLGGVQGRATIDDQRPNESASDENVESDWLAGGAGTSGDTESAEKTDSVSADSAENDDYRLPRLADVNSPIRWIPMTGLQQSDPSGLLHPNANRSSVSLDAETGQILSSRQFVDQITYDQLSGHPAVVSISTWEPANFYHRPVWLEDPNLERYGNHSRYENVRSGVRFFASIPTLPYQIGRDGLNSRIYTLQHDRPGDYVPSRSKDFTFDRRGALLQGLVTSAIIIP